MGRIRTVAVLPTLFTLGNLVCGFFAIVVASRVEAPTSIVAPQGIPLGTRSPIKAVQALDPEDPVHNVMLSGWLIFLAMVFDALDGHVARLSNWTSEFGGQLDSLCDLVTFGVAPAFLLVKMCPSFTHLHKDWAWVIAASYVVCAALRLARFSVETGAEDDHFHFSGLPSPAAAASIAGFAIMFYTLRRSDNPLVYAGQIDTVLQAVLPFFAALVALLMVSRIPYPHVVSQMLSGQRSLGHVVGLVFALVAIMVIRGYAVPLVCCGFVAYGPIKYVWEEWVQRQPHKDPLF
jgi:CDP-diacylglycerol--serine O-phosphatidyltransferase